MKTVSGVELDAQQTAGCEGEQKKGKAGLRTINLGVVRYARGQVSREWPARSSDLEGLQKPPVSTSRKYW